MGVQDSKLVFYSKEMFVFVSQNFTIHAHNLNLEPH